MSYVIPRDNVDVEVVRAAQHQADDEQELFEIT